jgi:hypothetical protein
MKWLTALVAIGVGSSIIGPAAKAQPRPVITITDVAGRLRGSFAPLEESRKCDRMSSSSPAISSVTTGRSSIRWSGSIRSSRAGAWERLRRYTAGEFVLTGNRRMYISRGVGHLLQVRFNVRPEVTVFELRPA